jgi:sugar phosphate isomerase/epimerase
VNRLGIEMLSLFGLPPVESVNVAADLGCAHISTALTQMPAQFNPLGYPDWSLLDDPVLRRAMRDALRSRGVSVSLGEGFAVRPGVSMRDRAREMDAMADLGARGLGAVGMEPDAARAFDEFATLAEMAAARGMIATLEFAPPQVVSTLEQAVGIVQAVGQPHFRLLIDAMHLFRSGGSVEDVSVLDPALIGYAQLCDVPLVAPGADYLDEAMNARRAPGDGELPLAALVAVLPADIPVSLEIPMLAAAQAGIEARDRLRPAVAAARRLLAAVAGNPTAL